MAMEGASISKSTEINSSFSYKSHECSSSSITSHTQTEWDYLLGPFDIYYCKITLGTEILDLFMGKFESLIINIL